MKIKIELTQRQFDLLKEAVFEYSVVCSNGMDNRDGTKDNAMTSLFNRVVKLHDNLIVQDFKQQRAKK